MSDEVYQDETAIAGTDPMPEEVVTPDPDPAEAPAVEETPEQKAEREEAAKQEEEKKRLSGSARKALQIQALKAELEALKSQIQGGNQPRNDAPMAEPRFDDPSFNSVEEFVAARDAYVKQQAMREAQMQFLSEQAQREMQIKKQAWQQKLETAVKEDPSIAANYETFLAVGGVVTAQNPTVANVAWEYIQSSEAGPRLVNAIASDPEAFAEKLARMSPVQAIAELAKLEAKLDQPKPKPETKAPAPPKPLGNLGTAPRKGYNVEIDY